MYNLAGKVGLITGGSMGIGAAIAKKFLQVGLKGVSIVDINTKKGLQIVEELNKKFGKGKAIFIKADVSQRNEFDDAFKETIAVFKNLDIVVNSAGIVTERQWEKEIDVNLTGSVNGTILAFDNYLPKHKSGEEGIIVNISSLAGLRLSPDTPIYCATKSGVIALTQNLGFKKHYERTKVKVFSICPGFTNTTIFNIDENTLLGPDYLKIHEKLLTLFKHQPVTAVSDAVSKIIEVGKSGSVWIVQNNEPAYEVEFSYNIVNKL